MLTARDDEVDEVVGLEVGADDAAPFDILLCGTVLHGADTNNRFANSWAVGILSSWSSSLSHWGSAGIASSLPYLSQFSSPAGSSSSCCWSPAASLEDDRVLTSSSILSIPPYERALIFDRSSGVDFTFLSPVAAAVAGGAVGGVAIAGDDAVFAACPTVLLE